MGAVFPMIGFKIGSYHITESLGQGTSATTWLARDDSGKPAVAKRLLDPLAAEPMVVERFLSVVEFSSKIRMRKHVATVLARKHCSEGVFLLRQYVEGEPLARYAERGELAAWVRDQTDQIARDVCDALRALASRGVIHGGLHPGNVVVQPDGRVKVTDFGIGAAMLTRRVPRSKLLEAFAYLAPEQWRGAEAVIQTDIYSAAAIIHLVDRKAPLFRSTDARQLERAIITGRSDICPVLAAALDPEPARRYPGIEELAVRLPERLLADVPITEQSPPPAQTSVSPPTVPLPLAAGRLAWIYDIRQQRNLLDNSPPKPWIVARDGRRHQRPLQVANAGSGDLELSVSCTGDGLTASPSQLTIRPGQMGAVMVRLTPDSASFANLIFRWNECDAKQMLVVKVIRRR